MSARVWVGVAGLVTLLGLASAASPAEGQSLTERIREARAERVSFRFATRPGVMRCEGTWRGQHRSYGDALDDGCWTGPSEVQLRIADGEVVRLDWEIVRAGAAADRGWTSLGTVPPQAAADYLLDLARTARSSVAKDAIGAAAAAADVEIWQELLALARDGSRPRDVRESATFWLGQATSDHATRGLADLAESDPDVEVRRAAVFALSQRDEATAVDVLIAIARENDHHEVRKSAFFWLAQRGGPDVLDFFEEVLSGPSGG